VGRYNGIGVQGTALVNGQKEKGMSGRVRIALPAAILLIVLAIVAAFPPAGEGADQLTSVMGIAERVSETLVSVGGKTYDFKGVPIRSAQGGNTVEISSLRGKTVEIVFRNRKIVSVTVYRTLPQ
jgi:hypothetical protein